MAKNDIELIIFDVDGTLLDTSEFIYQAYEHTLRTHGQKQHNRKVVSEVIGRKLEDCYAFLAPDVAIDLLTTTHREFQSKNLALVRPFQYCQETLEILKTAGKRLAICTSRTRNVEESLQIGGIDPAIFDCIVTAAMVTHPKPDPEGVLLILGKMDASKQSTLFVGDADVDILAGKNAKVAATIGITHGFGSRKALEIAEADHIIDSLDQLLPLCGVPNGS